MNKESGNWNRDIIATLVLAWPIILSNLSTALVNATDVWLLGRVSKDALAASAIGVGIVVAFFVFGIGLVQSVSPIIAKELGAKAHSVREVRRSVRASFWLALMFSIPAMIILWFTGDIAKLSGMNETLANDVAIFTRALEFEIFPILLIVAMRNFITALHRPIWAMIIGFAMVAINAIINSGLILGMWGFPKLGLVGAGIGSSIEAYICVGLFVLVINNHKLFRRYHIFGHIWHFDAARIAELWRLGWPIGMQIGFEAAVFSAAVFLMGLIDNVSAAAHSIAIQIATLTFMVPMSIAQAATVRVGNALGRQDAVGIGRAGWSALILGVGFMCISALLIFIFPRQLAEIFIDEHVQDAAATIIVAIGFLKIAALFQIVDGAQVVGAGMLRGLHDTRWPMIFAGFGYWGIGIGVGAYLAFKTPLAGNGIWLGLALGLAIVSVLMIWRWARREKIGLTSF